LTVVHATPLLPTTLAVIAVAFLLRADSLLGALVAVVTVIALSMLAVASVGRLRLVWLTAGAAVAALFAHALVPVALLPAGPSFELPRAALAHPLELLIPAPESALLIGIVLGDRTGVPPDLARAFAASGTTHLLAISGFNMTLVATAVALALRGRVGPVARTLASVLAIVGYSLLVGLSASVLRAALMAAVASCGIVSGRRAATANALCVAVTAMLVADPTAVDDLGLQLSALATAGLVLWQAALSERLAMLPSPVRDGLATTIAATAPTLPVIAGAFGRLSLISPLANLVCVPSFPVLMLAGAATSVIGAAWLDAARPIALLAWVSAFSLRTGVETFASLPLASVTVPAGALTGILVGAFEVGVVFVARRLTSPGAWRVIAQRAASLRPSAPRPTLPRGGLVAGLIVAVAVPLALGAWPDGAGSTRVVALDVGQGDAYFVDAGGALALIDGGPDPARVLDELGATLPPWRRRIDVIALTHAHTDHGAGLLAVLERYDVGLAIEPVGLNPSPLTDLWSAALAKRGIERRAVHAGQRIQLGAATIDVLAPAEDLVVDTPSLVLRVERGAFSALFTGDAVDGALGRLLERPERLRSRVYVPPHHGAQTQYAGALRASARPEAALISVGAGNRYGHPTPETLQALAGVPTYRTDKDGTVEIALDGTGLVVRTHANALPPPRRGFVPYSAASERARPFAARG
jgi:competence protein ComEC